MASSDAGSSNLIRKRASEGECSSGRAQRARIPPTFPISCKWFVGDFPRFRKPTELGCFSLDGARYFHNNNSQMKYIDTEFGDLPIDLNEGYYQAVRKDFHRNEKLDSILRWITLNRQQVLSNFPEPPESNKCFGANFVCYRGLLTTLLCSPYEYKEDWMICASKFRGTIYLCAFPTAQKIRAERNKSSREDLMCFWGKKFEHCVATSTPRGRTDRRATVNENEEFCLVAKGRIVNNNILFAAEVDGVDPSFVPNAENINSMDRYLELKTTRFMAPGNRALKFIGHKLMKWWAQSFVIGIPRIMCGFRDDDGIVTSVDVFETKMLASISKETWNTSKMMLCCDRFLNFVQKHVIEDNPNIVYKFYCAAGKEVTFEELPSPVSEEYRVLPKWYTSSWERRGPLAAVGWA